MYGSFECNDQVSNKAQFKDCSQHCSSKIFELGKKAKIVIAVRNIMQKLQYAVLIRAQQ